VEYSRALFASIVALLSLAGCVAIAPVAQQTENGEIPPEWATKSFVGSGITDSFQPWPELIKGGETYGLDFSNPIFQRIYSLESGTRSCNASQDSLVRSRKFVDIGTICWLIDSTHTNYQWVRAGLTTDEAVARSVKFISEERKKKGYPNAQNTDIRKEREEGGITYFQFHIGDVSEYRAVMVIENETTAQLGVKVLVSVTGPAKSRALVDQRILLLKNRVRSYAKE
jgi:hypothetical protein